MKFTKLFILAAATLIAASVSALAQAGFDTFATTRTIVLAAPQNIGAASGLTTNGPIDLVKLTGVGKIDLVTVTNTGTTGGTLTATLYGSSDQTNLTALASFALITATTTDTITNVNYGGTNLTAANSVLLPGVLNTPTIATAGFGTPYLSALPFTNSGAITLTGNKTVQVGLRVADQPRYLYLVYAPGGTVTNFTASALLTGRAKL